MVFGLLVIDRGFVPPSGGPGGEHSAACARRRSSGKNPTALRSGQQKAPARTADVEDMHIAPGSSALAPESHLFRY